MLAAEQCAYTELERLANQKQRKQYGGTKRNLKRDREEAGTPGSEASAAEERGGSSIGSPASSTDAQPSDEGAQAETPDHRPVKLRRVDERSVKDELRIFTCCEKDCCSCVFYTLVPACSKMRHSVIIYDYLTDGMEWNGTTRGRSPA